MACSPEEVKSFIKDAKKGREGWLTWADRSWSELKKRQRNNRLLSINPNSAKKRAKYPVWWSIFKIRQPLLLARVGIPLCKDTTQDGLDNIGASAAFFKERLAVNLAKSFDFFEALSAVRDDLLATNFGMARAYYERDEIKEKVKEYITPQQVPGTEDMMFVDGAGNAIDEQEINQDDDGFFIESDKVVDVENERIYLEPLLYREVYIDSDARRWARVERIAFEVMFSVPQFKATFGSKAYAKLAKPEDDASDESSPKRQTIKVYEYWDRYERDVYWLPENCDDFVYPLKATLPEEYEEDEQPNGLYDLERLFPVPPPIITNQSTDEFWPSMIEYYQVVEIIEDIHTIFSRMMALTRAIRARVLFDNNIEGLQEALNEATEGDAFGVPNLAQSLVNNGGSLEGVVQYIPVEKMIESLGQVSLQLEQRLNTLYRLTGVSDLLQGLMSDQGQRTFGERQMLEKYALNQHAEPQQKMQEFVRDCYELLCEMAIKNFKDESLERYMIPQTAPPVHQQNFKAALGLLKNDRKRFRIELETDSTIALNEQYSKQMAVELVNTLTLAIEKVAGIAQSNPALVEVELHCLKFLIQSFRQGKLFQQEVSQAIDNVIKNIQAQSEAEPPPDPAMMQLQIEQQKLKLEEARIMTEQQKVANDSKLKEYQILADERIETARLQLEQQVSSIKGQLDQMAMQMSAQDDAAKRQLEFEKVRSEIAVAQTELAQRAQEIEIEVAKLGDARMKAVYEAQATERLAYIDAELKASAQRLEEQRTQMEMGERWATEQRLQQEHELEKLYKAVEIAAKQAEVQQSAIIAASEARAIQAPPPPKATKRIKIKRDEAGNASEYEIEGGSGYRVVRDANGEIEGYEPIGGV